MDNVVEFQTSKSPRILWGVIFALVAFHAAAIWALFSFSWANLAAVAILWWISGSLGIGLGYHRLLTHRGYKTPKWMEYFLTLCASLAIQGGPLSWVTTHRIHHAKTELHSRAVYLSVTSSNTDAIALYQSRGFKRWGTEPYAMGIHGKFLNEDHFVLELSSHGVS